MSNTVDYCERCGEGEVCCCASRRRDSFDEYRAIEAINWSSLKLIGTHSPLMYKWRADHPEPEKESFNLGTATHTAILEPEEFYSRHVVRPPGVDFRTRDGIAWKKAQDPSKSILTTAQGAAIGHCMMSVGNHGYASALLEDTSREVTVEWEIDGIKCKCRADILDRHDGTDGYVADLKTCRELARFESDATRLLYYGQSAWYFDGCVSAGLLEPDSSSYILAAETNEPYDCAVYRMAPSILQHGRVLYQGLFRLWRECVEADIWPGQCPGVTEFEIPRWAIQDEEEGF